MFTDCMHTCQGSGKSLSSCVLSLEGGVVSVIAGGAVTDVLQLDKEADTLKNDDSYVEPSILSFFTLLVCSVSSSSHAGRMW